MKTSFIEKWQGITFESSSSITPQLKEFLTDFRRYIVDLVEPDFVLTDFNRGHFCCSGFLKYHETPTSEKDTSQTQSYIYFSISDVRHSPDNWINNILIRTARNPQDYTGGCNNYCKLCDLLQAANNLIQK